MGLPTERSKTQQNMSDYTIFIYGPPKVGKTTWAAGFPNLLFLATEAGHKALSVFKIDIDTWDKFLAACNELAAGKHNYKNVCIDTIDNLWRLCIRHICEKHNVEYEGDLTYGKGHALVLNEFLRALTKLSMLPYGLILVSHSALNEIDDRTGKYKKTVPSLKEKPRKFALGMSDYIFYFTMRHVGGEGESKMQRIIYTKPSKFYDAGDRSGHLPEALPMNYDTFLKVFNEAIKKGDKK